MPFKSNLEIYETGRPLTLDAFVQLLSDALNAPIPSELPELLESPTGFDEKSFNYWHSYIESQINSLSALRESDVLKDPLSAFGAVSPYGGTWYNTATQVYLERAAAAMFGFSEAPLSEEALQPLTWNEFSHFLEMGQYYE